MREKGTLKEPMHESDGENACLAHLPEAESVPPTDTCLVRHLVQQLRIEPSNKVSEKRFKAN
jgi:hypothetical protein